MCVCVCVSGLCVCLISCVHSADVVLFVVMVRRLDL